ncbi:MAG: BREX-2 system adenine-specific DNA-methyltransferase PglX, partial [Frankia sp.]|nr:BREX-2 system adenine-specific DNA-methyltransferase PglX [Frankia sp.]
PAPRPPRDGADGQAWRAIVAQASSRWTSVADRPRAELATAAWDLTSAEARLLARFRAAPSVGPPRLGAVAAAIGPVTRTGLDDVYYLPWSTARARELTRACVPVVRGDDVAEYALAVRAWAYFPYDAHGRRREPDEVELRFLEPYRTLLRRRAEAGETPEQRGLRWFDHAVFFPERFVARRSLVFAPGHPERGFALDRGGKLVDATAGVLQLLPGAVEEDYLRLLGLLNSSTVAWWRNRAPHPDDAARLADLPLPADYPLELARELDRLAHRRAAASPVTVLAEQGGDAGALAAARAEWTSLRARMAAMQEELDWQVYQHYGLLGGAAGLVAPPGGLAGVPGIEPGERAFELAAAGREPPGHWPADHRALVARRIAVLRADPAIALIEQAEHKRSWPPATGEDFDALAAQAMREWLLDRCAQRGLWFHEVDGQERPRLRAVDELADQLAADTDVAAVAGCYRPGVPAADVLAELLRAEHVPAPAALRLTESGLAKLAAWEQVWDCQRAEDGEPLASARLAIRAATPTPPLYLADDFRRPGYWQARGPLDAPRERFTSWPGADGPLLGWAGWDRAEQAEAVRALLTGDGEGWHPYQPLPVLAGLRELLAGLRRWHDGAATASLATTLAEALARHHLTDADLTAWRPSDATGED